MSGFVKMFSSIVTSSIWLEATSTLRVWIAMLALADADGVVEGSVPGFANLARVSIEEMLAAEKTLSSPDMYSRTPDHEGRRIEAIEGGWRILNYRSYRDRGQAKDGSKAPAMRRYRERLRATEGNALPRSVESGNALPPEVTRYPEERGERREAVRTSKVVPEEGTVESAATQSVASPPVLTFPCRGTSATWNLTTERLARWVELYPGLDVLAECRKALAYVEAKGAKTARGTPGFLVGWLNNAVDWNRGGHRPSSPSRTAGNVEALQRFAQRVS